MRSRQIRSRPAATTGCCRQLCKPTSSLPRRPTSLPRRKSPAGKLSGWMTSHLTTGAKEETMNNTHQAYSGGRPVFIVDGDRTPFLKAQGKPGPFRASDLAVAAGKALLARQTFAPESLDEVILGCIIPGPDEVNIARLVALRLGCGKQVPAGTVQRNCGSGMQAIDSAATDIAYGRADLVLAG